MSNKALTRHPLLYLVLPLAHFSLALSLYRIQLNLVISISQEHPGGRDLVIFNSNFLH